MFFVLAAKMDHLYDAYTNIYFLNLKFFIDFKILMKFKNFFEEIFTSILAFNQKKMK